MENNEADKKRDRNLLNHEFGLRELNDSFKHNNIRVIEAPENEEGEKGTKSLFGQIIAENYPNLQKDMA